MQLVSAILVKGCLNLSYVFVGSLEIKMAVYALTWRLISLCAQLPVNQFPVCLKTDPNVTLLVGHIGILAVTVEASLYVVDSF